MGRRKANDEAAIESIDRATETMIADNDAPEVAPPAVVQLSERLQHSVAKMLQSATPDSNGEATKRHPTYAEYIVTGYSDKLQANVVIGRYATRGKLAKWYAQVCGLLEANYSQISVSKARVCDFAGAIIR